MQVLGLGVQRFRTPQLGKLGYRFIDVHGRVPYVRARFLGSPQPKRGGEDVAVSKRVLQGLGASQDL